jgi:hypothetical protein
MANQFLIVLIENIKALFLETDHHTVASICNRNWDQH